MKTPYNEIPIIADTETPIKKYLYFLTIKPNKNPYEEIDSDSETNFYLKKNYKKKFIYNERFEPLNYKNSINPKEISPLSENWKTQTSGYYKKLKKNNYRIYRNSSRKDTNLRYKRN
jgi:hypothetical protein